MEDAVALWRPSGATIRDEATTGALNVGLPGGVNGKLLDAVH